jgi:hypothetical protein
MNIKQHWDGLSYTEKGLRIGFVLAVFGYIPIGAAMTSQGGMFTCVIKDIDDFITCHSTLIVLYPIFCWPYIVSIIAFPTVIGLFWDKRKKGEK